MSLMSCMAPAFIADPCDMPAMFPMPDIPDMPEWFMLMPLVPVLRKPAASSSGDLKLKSASITTTSCSSRWRSAGSAMMSGANISCS